MIFRNGFGGLRGGGRARVRADRSTDNDVRTCLSSVGRGGGNAMGLPRCHPMVPLSRSTKVDFPALKRETK